MTDIIQLLPDSVANQIAAGEVIQRPASVVKELVENAVDAGAISIKVNLTDAGKTLIQIVDNGLGMSETDARMSFERHATSKIRKAEDLFAIRTLGFRGEALASIAAIAHVELKTRRKEDELGTELIIAGTKVQSQHNIQCPVGSNFLVKNLFFNIPVRRKFLKSNTTELKYVINEFQRVAMTQPNVAFTLSHNNTEIYNLPVENLALRIARLFRKNINQHLVKIDTQTSIVNISGYIGKPEVARKNSGEQYFFANNRFMKHPYFSKAVSMAYEKLLPPDAWPTFFIYLDVNPDTVDVNIHPTKTEIKFEDEANIWKILNISVRESLGKFNVAPSLDFDMPNRVDIPVLRKDTEIRPPEIKVDPTFNPFEKPSSGSSSSSSFSKKPKNPNLENWETLYEGFENQKEETQLTFKSDLHEGKDAESDIQPSNQISFQLKNKYILTSVKSGLMVIDQRRAHERVLYERFLFQLNNKKGISQKSLFAEAIALDASEALLLEEIMPMLTDLGFEIEKTGELHYDIHGCPSDINIQQAPGMLEKILELYRESESELKVDGRDKIALAMAKASAIGYGKVLGNEEMQQLIDSLFACSVPNYTSDGKPVLTILELGQIEALLK
ncbi:MAG: DNA mismatch repair endonuclease MutL [Bacteroidales bacterium]|nr:DNA mismatch repair endonuclease MutL [Bacteroidales bacterium]MCF8455818.1 DNA mismatch repair endonuclease MutL [Bacteroidales bacterium]